ncbi:MAG TPA: hypothetical protein VL306_00565 [Methylomirabilota bacterium]|nr:hypothetical protein [Methylomirabilota bacterium]
MFQNFLIRKMLKSQGVSDSQIDAMLVIIQKNPELFKKIASEAQELTKTGMTQADATMQVMKKYEQELKNLAS